MPSAFSPQGSAPPREERATHQLQSGIIGMDIESNTGIKSSNAIVFQQLTHGAIKKSLEGHGGSAPGGFVSGQWRTILLWCIASRDHRNQVCVDALCCTAVDRNSLMGTYDLFDIVRDSLVVKTTLQRRYLAMARWNCSVIHSDWFYPHLLLGNIISGALYEYRFTATQNPSVDDNTTELYVECHPFWEVPFDHEGKDNDEPLEGLRSDSATKPPLATAAVEMKMWPVKSHDSYKRSYLFVYGGSKSGIALFSLNLPFNELKSFKNPASLVQCQCGRWDVILEERLRGCLRVGRKEYSNQTGMIAMLECGRDLYEGGMCLLAVATSIRCRFGEKFHALYGDCTNFGRILQGSYWGHRPRRFVGNLEMLDRVGQKLLGFAENRPRSLIGCLVGGDMSLQLFSVDYDVGDPVEDKVLQACFDCTHDDDEVLVLAVIPSKPGYVCVIWNGGFQYPQDHEVQRVLLGCCQAAPESSVNGRRVVLANNFLDGHVSYAVESGSGCLEIMESSELFSP